MGEFEQITRRLESLEQRIERLERGNSVPKIDHNGTFNDAQRKDFYVSLSDQEQRIVYRVTRGMSNLDIGNDLFLSKGTVANYLGLIYSKLEATGIFGDSKVDRQLLMRFMGDYLDRHPELCQAGESGITH